MPARISKTTAANAPTTTATESTSRGLLARLLEVGPRVQRFALWLGMTLAGTYAMGSAVNVFFSSGSSQSQDAKVEGASRSQTSSGSSFGGWWNPSAANSYTSTDYRPISNNGDTGASAGSISVIPANTGLPVYSGTLTLTNLTPIGANFAQRAYDILGLRTGSTPLSLIAATPAVASSGNTSSATLVSFSLSGNTNLVPVNNLEAGGLNMTPALVPEPTTTGMLVTGLAGLAFTRRRQRRSR